MTSKFSFLKIAFTAPGKLSEKEEMDLLHKYQSGDMQSYNKLELSLRPLVEKAISDSIPSGNEVSPSILRMRAVVELPKILQNYDLTRDVKLKTFILNQLRGYMRNTAAENVSGPYVPRNQHPDLYRYKKAIREAEMEHGKNPTEEQIRSFYPNDTTTPFDKIKTYHVNSYLNDAVFGGNDESDGMTFKDKFTDGTRVTDDDLFADLYDEEENDLVSKQFNPNEQAIIHKVNKEGQPFVQVALSHGMSTGDVRKVIRRWHDLTGNQ
jgi:DNA-directed RNA polymerase specialized sigma subunit